MSDRQVEYLLIGGGLAAGNCARWLRQSGADGSILLVGREPDLPYNRPPCSKGYLQGKESREDVLFRPAGWFTEQQIEVLTRTSVMKLDLAAHTVKLSDRSEIGFGKALLATGANVRRLNVPGCELEGIHYLRTLANSEAIREDASGKRVVLIGGSYVASEVAASLTELGSTCTMVMIEPVVLSRGFGLRAGRFLQSALEERGITVLGDDELERFEGSDGRVTRVITKAGRELEADAIVIGVGAVPGIYAAGDIAQFDSVVNGGASIRVEHWDVAFNHGKTAALNMLGHDTPHDVVPYFFSDLSDWVSLEYVGPAFEWDREVVRGSLGDGEFTVFYLQSARVAGALSVGRSDDLDAARRLISSAADLADKVEALGDLSSDLSQL